MPRHLLPPKPFIPAPNCASVELFYSFNAIIAENVFHVSKGSPFSGSDLVALRGVVNAWDSVTWAGSRSANVTIFRIRSKALDTNSSPVDDYYLPTPRAGTIGSATVPGNVTYAIKLATGLAGRSYRGRWYMVGLAGASLSTNPNQITPASSAALVTWLNTLMTNLASAGYTLGVLSYATGGAWRTTAHFQAATGFVAVDYNLDSQRRRLTGRGI
jgi:hypothetical protein